MTRRFRLAYVPRRVERELLGSWLLRLGNGLGASVADVLGPGYPDVDWQATPQLLSRLSQETGRPLAELTTMTLSGAYPGAARADFARSAGGMFAGCHGYCPACRAVVSPWPEPPVSTIGDAGFWRVTCKVHGCFLDSLEAAPSVMARRARQICRLSPLGRSEPAAAPAFARAFERAAEKARRGRVLGAAWRVREPAAFLAAARELANLSLVRRVANDCRVSAASLLMLDPDLARHESGRLHYDGQLVDALPTWPRVRALASAGLLLLTPDAARRLKVSAWAAERDPFANPFLIERTPWRLVAQNWSRGTLELVLARCNAWPAGLRAPAAEACSAALRRFGPS